MNNSKRLYYLDWIRVITILVVFLFHSARFFDNDDWHVKNAITSPIAGLFTFSLGEWIMPLFFIISGASTWYALQFKSIGRFLIDRVTRILIPLIFGILILSPPQVYLERLSHHQFHGSFFDFLPHYFSGWYGLGGNFAWMGLHLWYLMLLFAFSILALPIFILIKTFKSDKASSFAGFYLPAFIFIVAIPGFFLIPDGLIYGRIWGGWSIIEHFCFFVIGFFIYSKYSITGVLLRYRIIILAVTLVLTTINLYFYWHYVRFPFDSILWDLKILLRSAVCFGWIFSIIGFAEQYLNYNSERLKYSSESVLPFYILHQPVIVLIGFYIVQSGMPLGLKYLVIVVLSFTLIILIYHFIVRKVNVLRYIMGMNKLPAKQ